jgi:hypothetical protein
MVFTSFSGRLFLQGYSVARRTTGGKNPESHGKRVPKSINKYAKSYWQKFLIAFYFTAKNKLVLRRVRNSAR